MRNLNRFSIIMNNYAFIEAQNLNLGVSKDIYLDDKIIYKAWKLDLKRLRIYLKEHYKVKKAYLFVGYTTALK